MVNRISDQVDLAATYVQQGGIELQKAVVYKQSGRKVRLLGAELGLHIYAAIELLLDYANAAVDCL